MKLVLSAARGIVVFGLLLVGVRAQAPQDAADVQRRLAEIELQVSVDRDVAGAEAALAELELACAGTELAAVLAQPDAQALRARIVAAVAAARSPDQGSLQQILANALRQNDEITLNTLGKEAAAALSASLLSDEPPLNDIPAATRMLWLLRLDEAEAWNLLKDEPGRLPLVRAARVDLVNLVQSEGLRWIIREGRTPVLERPEWLDLLARLLEQPSAAQDFGDRQAGTKYLNDLVEDLNVHDAFTPRLVEVLGNLISAMDGYAAVSVMRTFGRTLAPSAQPLLERLVLDPRPAIRQQAAEALEQAEVSPALRSRVEDPSVDVRFSLVQSLGVRPRTVPYWSERRSSPRLDNESIGPAVDAEARNLLAKLATDMDPAVREAVVRVLAQKDAASLDADVYRGLAADTDALVRTALVEVKLTDAALQTEVLAMLARDTVPQVATAVDNRLRSADWTTGSAALIPVLRARLDNRVVPMNWVPDSLVRSGVARDELTRIIVRTRDDRLCALLAEWALTRNQGEPRLNSTTLPNDWAGLAGDELAVLLPMLERVSPLLPRAVADQAYDRAVDPSVPAALDPLVADATQTLRFRLAACALTLHDPTPARRQRLIELLSDAALREGTPDANEDEWSVGAAIRSVPAAQRNAVIRDVLQSTAMRDELAQKVAEAYDPKAPDAIDVTRLILEKYLDRDDPGFYFVQQALVHVGRTPELASEGLFRRALRPPGYYAGNAISAIARLRDPQYLGLLRECLDVSWDINGEIAPAAVNALQAYMSDEAAAILLDAAANSPRGSVREQALEAVEAIGRYRDALAAWQRRTASAASRDEAVGRLVVIVANKAGPEDVRAEAVRALGVLQAVEQMPLVIDALMDNSKDVREAARDALARLNASAAVPGSAPAKPQPPSDPEPAPDQP